MLRALQADRTVKTSENLSYICPYLALNAFKEEHAALFFGREEFAERLLKKLSNQNFIAVIGSSGSGKSSVVQAGLVPLPRRQRTPAKTWDVVGFTPGNRPFHRLANALTPLLDPDLSEYQRQRQIEEFGTDFARYFAASEPSKVDA